MKQRPWEPESTDARMAQLWAPWRLAYVAPEPTARPQAECFLCTGVQGADDRANFVVLRRPKSVVVLNRYPYNNGHLLVAPNRHQGALADLVAGELLELHETLRDVMAALDHIMHPDGYNVGLN